MVLASWSRVFNVPPETVVAPEAIVPLQRTAKNCLETFFDLLDVAIVEIATYGCGTERRDRANRHS